MAKDANIRGQRYRTGRIFTVSCEENAEISKFENKSRREKLKCVGREI
jgi:hypothetical protein